PEDRPQPPKTATISGTASTTTTSTTTPSTTVGGSPCADPPVQLTKGAELGEGIVATIHITCPAPDGEKYYVISEISYAGANPFTEYYVVAFRLPTTSGDADYTWRVDGLERHLYVVAVTSSQEEQLLNFLDPAKRLLRQLPAGLSPISNVLEQ